MRSFELPLKGVLVPASRGLAIEEIAALERYDANLTFPTPPPGALLEDFGVAVLAGHLLGDDPGALRFKAATSVLYGHTPQSQELAIAAPDPVRLPHVDTVLSRLGEAFSKLAS